MLKIRLLLVSALLLLIFTASLSSQSLLIYVDEADAPYTYRNTITGETDGLYPHLLTNLFSLLDIDTVIEAVPWKRALYYARTGEAGVAGIYKTAEREKVFEFSDPYYQESIYLFSLKTRTDTPRSLEDLYGHSLGILTGWSYGEDFDRARQAGLFSFIEKNDDHSNFELLQSGRVDFILATRDAGELELSSDYFKNIRRLPRPFIENSVYLAFRRNSGRTGLLEKFNRLIAEKRKDGSYDRLTGKLLAEQKSSLSGAPGPSAR